MPSHASSAGSSVCFSTTPKAMIRKTGRRASATAAIGSPVTQAIERALQNVGGGHLVDEHGAALARGVGLDQRARYRRGRKTFVPKGDRESRHRREVLDEGAGRLRARAFGAVHIPRQADDEGA